ncbi:unnamed protein product [Trichobilharzia regenti]|nr:unnamed protein product [Trichobilharzia regenti]
MAFAMAFSITQYSSHILDDDNDDDYSDYDEYDEGNNIIIMITSIINDMTTHFSDMNIEGWVMVGGGDHNNDDNEDNDDDDDDDDCKLQ